jgi:hypothetical protein
MKRLLLVVAAALCSLPLLADNPDFSGTWAFNTSKGQNLGMMTQMKMTENIRQTPSAFDIEDQANFQGQLSTSKTHYDLTGKPAKNESPMAGPSETVTQWQDGKLVTTWTSAGAVSGTKVVRTETRLLSPDGQTMTVQSERTGKPPVVLVFDKKK